MDHSLCCKDRLKTILTEKRKRSNSFEFGYNADSDDETYKKKKKMKTNILSHMSAAITNKNSQNKSYLAPESPNMWQSQIQDEVVCTPDLSLLMEDDDSSAQTSTETPPPAQPLSPIPSCSTVLPPPLVALPSVRSKPNKDSDVQFVAQTRVLANAIARKTVVVSSSNLVTPNPNSLGYKLPVILNTSVTKPITTNNVQKNVMPNFVHLQAPAVRFTDTNEVQPIVRVAHNRNSSVINATPAKLAPGLRYEWFEKATQVTARVNQNLSARLCSLSKEQYSVTSLEGLASIHNNLQEILSNSINSLMQIRKSLRSDFIAGLKKLKFCKTQSQTIPDDNDVVVVDSTRSNSNTAQMTPSINTSGGNKPTGYIKVKPVSELFDSSVITIPDDNVTSKNSSCVFPSINNFIVPKNTITITKRNDNAILNGLLSSSNTNKQNSSIIVANKQVSKPVNYSNSNERPTLGTSSIIIPVTRHLVKKAVIESKLEALVSQNMKYNVVKISQRELKRMLSVRVVVETNFGKATPRTRPRKGYRAMNIGTLDLEELLSSSTIVTISKEKGSDTMTNQRESESHLGSKASEKDDEVQLLSDDDDDDKEVEIIEDRIQPIVTEEGSEKTSPEEVIDLENSDAVQQETSETLENVNQEISEITQLESSKEVDQQEISKEIEQQEISKEIEQQETSMEVDQQQSSKEVDQQETSKEFDQPETSMEVDLQGTSEVIQQESSEDIARQQTSENVASPRASPEETTQQETSEEIPQQQNDDNQDTSKETNNKSLEDNEEILNEITRPIDENDETLNEITTQLLGENESILKNHSESENVEACQNPCTTDSGIDVDGEQSLSNGLMNCQEND